MISNKGFIEYHEDSISVGLDYIYDEWNLIKEALQISIKQSESDIKFNFKEIISRSGKFLKINNFIIQIVSCSHFDNQINIPISQWLKNGKTPQIVLAAEVDNENNIVYFPGVLTGNEFRELLSNQNEIIDNVKISISNFEGGTDLLFRYITLLEPNSIPRTSINKSKKSILRFSLFNKDNLILGNIALASIIGLVFIPKILEPRLASNISVLEGKNFLIANNLRGEDLSQQKFCLLSPHQQNVELYSRDKIFISIDKPVLIFKDTLNEIKIIKDNKVIWQMTASIDKKIKGPLQWPINPIKSGDFYTLRIRPDGSSIGNYRDIFLDATKGNIQKLGEFEKKLGKNSSNWIRQINNNLEKNPNLSLALLFSNNIPESEVLLKTRNIFLKDNFCN